MAEERKEDNKLDEAEKKEKELTAWAEEMAAMVIANRVKKLEERLGSLTMPSAIREEPVDPSTLAPEVIHAKTHFLQSELERKNSAMPEMYKKGAEVQLAVVKNSISEAKDMATLEEVQEDITARLEAKIELTSTATGDLVEFYRSCFAAAHNKHLTTEEQDEALLPVLDDLMRTLKDKLNFVLERLFPDEKPMIIEILTFLEGAKKRGGDGWADLKEFMSRRVDEGGDDEEDDEEMSTTEENNRPGWNETPHPIFLTNDPNIVKYFPALHILLNTNIIEYNPDDPNLFRLFE